MKERPTLGYPGERELGPSHADYLCPARRTSAGLKDTATQSVKDAYAGLKGLIQRRFHSRNEAEVALARHKATPEVWAPALREELA
jgi:hypothetical protein